jgi:hypothetical protein
MCSFQGDIINQRPCISVSYRQVTCSSIGSEKLKWCISFGDITVWINTTVVLMVKSQWRSLEANYLWIYLGRYSSGKSEMPKQCGLENFEVRGKEGTVKDFRETVYEGAKSIHLAEERIVWQTFCKHEKPFSNHRRGFLYTCVKCQTPNTWARHSQISVISVDGCGKSRHHRDSIPDRPARSQLLSRSTHTRKYA